MRVTRPPGRPTRQADGTRAPSSKNTRATPKNATPKTAAPNVRPPHVAAKQHAVSLPPALPSDPGALAAFARAIERDATLGLTRAEKAHKLDDALLAWLAAALGEDAPRSSRPHGALSNAALVAARRGALEDDPGKRLGAQAAARALCGDLPGARALFAAAAEHPLSFLERRGVHRALRVLDDAAAATALDTAAARLARAPAFNDPVAVAGAVAAEARALAHEHPGRALDFAALALEAHARAGDVKEHLPAIVALIKDAGRAQSATRTPAVAHKALLLATAAELSGNTVGARAAYGRVLEMAHASPRELRGAHAALAKLAATRGDLEEARVHADALRALAGPLTQHALTGSSSAFQTRLLQTDVTPALQRALAPRTQADLGHAFHRAIEVLAALPLARAADVPLAFLVQHGKGERPFSMPGGASDIGALVALHARDVSLLPATAASPDLADDGTHFLGGILKSHRGESHTHSRSALALSFGLLAALASTDKRVAATVVAPAPPGAPPSPAAVAEAREQLESLIADRTHGPPSLDDARARLRAHGWRPERGGALAKDGLRIRFEPFSIAQTEAFHARLDVADATAGTTAEGTVEGTAAFKSGAREAAHTVHVGALAFSKDEWALFSQGFEDTLARYQRDLERPALADRKAAGIDPIRRLLSAGRPVEEIPAKREDLLAIHDKAQQASALLAELRTMGRAPTSIFIGVEGIDAASKTSNGMRIKALAEANGYAGRWLSFKGPTAEERAQHWLLRYQKQAPRDGEVFLSDRTFLGDYAYNPSATPERMREMARDVGAWQARMKADGALVMNFLFDPRVADGGGAPDDVLERPMITFGKREARALIARDLLERFRDRLSPDERAALEAATLGPGYNDLKSFHEGFEAMERFLAFADAIEQASPGVKFIRIGTKTRQDGRERALDALLDALKALRDQPPR